MKSDNGESVSFRERYNGANLDSDIYDGQEFSINAVSMEGELDIGLSHSGGGEPPNEIVERELYEFVEASIRSVIDISTVESHTTTEMWPKLGSARVNFVDGGDVQVSIEILEEWIDDSS